MRMVRSTGMHVSVFDCVLKKEMNIIFTALICVFADTTSASGSLFIDGKAITGSKIPSEKNHISKLTGVLIKNNTSLKGFGIFISYRYFLTVAQALFEFEGSARDKFVVIPPELLTIQTENNVHNVLCYEMHRHYVLEKYINNIAVVLVGEYNYFDGIQEDKFPVQLPNKAVSKEDLELFAFKIKRENSHLYLSLRMLLIIPVPNSECPDTFKHLDVTQHFCGIAVPAFTEGSDIGSPLLEDNMVVGLFTYGLYRQPESVYVNVKEHITYIKEAKIRLGCKGVSEK